jgi:hypothetical protein
MDVLKHLLFKTITESSLVAHICNPSYSGGIRRTISSSGQAGQTREHFSPRKNNKSLLGAWLKL